MFSVIITAYNQHELTKVHVREAMESTLLPKEIIVVNDHGDPSLKNMLKDLPPKTRLVYAYIKDDIPWNYTGARNLGAVLATSPYIVSEDNDNIPERKLYEEMYAMLDNNEADIILGGKRKLTDLDSVLNKPFGEWTHLKDRPSHEDSFMMRRDNYWLLKGYDERMAGQYAWACTEWRRRTTGEANLRIDKVDEAYWTVKDGETKVCECDKSKEERAKTPLCKDCGLAFKRRSYKNYEYARRNQYLQPPEGILNFRYEFTDMW